MSEVHFRVLYILVAVAVLGLLRRPLRNRKTPGSTWFAIAVGSVAVWLACVGLYYFAADLRATLALYNTVLFAITICFCSWLLIAIEFATRKRPPRSLILFLGILAAGHFVVLWTNYVWLHELVYRASGTFIDDGGGFNTGREPVFWIHIVGVYVIIFAASAVFTAEWINAEGPRKRQAGLLAITPVAGVVTSVLWFAEVLRLPYDPTPIGVTVGIVVLGWALYSADYLEIMPIATRTVVEEMPDAVVIFDDRNRVVEWNRAARSLFGVENPSVGMPATSFFELVSSDVRTQLLSEEQGDAQISVEVQQQIRQFSVSKFVIETGQTLIGRALVLRDISELKRHENQLLAQNERLEEFTDIVSHDLQGPLMQIRSSVQAATATGDVTQVERVIPATDRIDGLVTDLLRLARTGRQLETEKPVDLDERARSAWTHVWSPSGDLVVETNRIAIGDPNRIQQLFENVFRNAIEHGSASDGHQTAQDSDGQRRTERDDSLIGVNQADISAERPLSEGHTAASTAIEETQISERRDDGPVSSDPTDDSDYSSPESECQGSGPTPEYFTSDVKITVGPLPGGFYIEDNGSGIPPKQRSRVFDKGYTNASSGTGIGLSIVRQIVEAHGWSIRVTEGNDGGARFEITDVKWHSISDGDRGWPAEQ